MRKVTAAVMASTLAFSAFSQAAEAIISDNSPLQEGATQNSSQSHMFDGIKFNRTSASTDARSDAAGKARQAPC